MAEWQEEFYRLYTSNSIENLRLALALKRRNIPEKLYRYRTFTDDRIELRKRENMLGKLYMSHMSEFNDPFEGWSILKSSTPVDYADKETFKQYYDSVGKTDEFQGIWDSESWFDDIVSFVVKEHGKGSRLEENKEALKLATMKGFEEINSDINELVRRMMRIACFATSAQNLPMWHHYTNAHTGICLEYDTSNIQNIFTINRLFPVRYVDRLPDMTYMLAHKQYPKGELFDVLSLHKLNDWSYENEWRLLYTVGSWYSSPEEVPNDFWDQGHEIVFTPPSKILLGKNISCSHEEVIRQWGEEMKIPVVKAICNHYGLSFE